MPADRTRDKMHQRRRIHVQGIVQGVGFRPFVFHLAEQYALAGWVRNNATGVVIEIQGPADALDEFTRAIETNAPPLAHIARLSSETIAPMGESGFIIAASDDTTEKRAWISPDACICDDCLDELFDPADRRYNYPFINCTNCGPRFTIVKDVPYDRPLTTMAPFVMCPQCRREYDDPRDRRFHAQPNACAVCGPTAVLEIESRVATNRDAIEVAGQLLGRGKILAVQGIGGFHLVCDASNIETVGTLRARKRRYDKPFALMVKDIEQARILCEISPAEEALLVSHRRPIVLLRAREPLGVAAQVAPNQKYLGVMLPYSPLHYMLLDSFARVKNGKPAVLVMTSGNLSDEPIAYVVQEAQERLASIADYFLTHDRAIHMRCDDSVARVVNHQPMLLRRSRGYVPEPLFVPQAFHAPLLAVGAHLKNTFCLGKGEYAFVSHHIGDLENFETWQSFTEGIEHFKKIFEVEPQAIVHDLHPEYLATKYAQEQAEMSGAVRLIGAQHHHAHIASVMGEHGLTGAVIGVALDGTGYGADGTIWGGEFLVADLREFERVAHLETLPLPGGEAAIHEVWRLAAAWLAQVYGDDFLELDLEFVRRLDRAKWRVLAQMTRQNINSPRSSAMGRLFDAVAALVGVRDVANYEAQAAIELEMLADEKCAARYPFTLSEEQPHILKTDTLLRAIVEDLRNGAPQSIIAAKFHNTVTELVAQTCAEIRRARGLTQVALGGGVFQNVFLLTRTMAQLRAMNFEVFVPTRLPPNDGGISFGQALIGNAKIRDAAARAMLT